MKRALEIELFLLMLAGIALMGFLGWRLNKTLAGMDAATAQLQPLIAGADQTLDAVNRRCGGGKPCGTLATLDKTITKVGDAVVTTQLEERATLPHVTSAMDSFKDTATALTGTAQEATKTLSMGQMGLQTANSVIQSFQPLSGQFTATLRQIDSTIPTLSATANNVNRMTADGARITADAAYEADKYTHPPKKKLTFWGGVWVGLTYVHKLMPPIF